MPLYPYRCTQCGHRFEKIQSFSAEPVKVCPVCGGPVERVLTAPGLQFKGAGWYVNDYSSKGGSSSGSSSGSSESKPGESKSESSSGAGSDTKPASALAKESSSSGSGGSGSSRSGSSSTS